MDHIIALVGVVTTWLEPVDVLISMSVGTIMVDALTNVSIWRVLIVVNVLLDIVYYPTNVTVLEEGYDVKITMEDVITYALTHQMVLDVLAVVVIS